MRLIDADKLIVPDKDCSGKCRDCNNHVTNCMELADLVNDAPTIDAVEVVRCKDCKYWRNDHTCHEHSLVSPMGANEFCSRGERGEADD